MKTTKLIKLSVGSLPAGKMVGAVFVTIWLVAAMFLALVIWKGRNGSVARYFKFQNIFWGTVALCFWYVLIVVDRWIRYTGYNVTASYILLQPFMEPFRVLSTILILSGLFEVLWDRESKEIPIWWTLNKVMILVVGIVSQFYLLLFMALAGCWLDYVSLITIHDLATKRSQFEVSMAALLATYALLILLAAGTICFHSAPIKDGHPRSHHIVTLLVALLLFARCLTELVLTGLVFSPRRTWADVQFAHDIFYGLLTVTALSMLFYLSRHPKVGPKAGNQYRLIESKIRETIISILNSETNGGTTKSPPLLDIIERVEKDVRDRHNTYNLFDNAAEDADEAKNARMALKYLGDLHKHECCREPKMYDNDDDSDNVTGLEPAGISFSNLYSFRNRYASLNGARNSAGRRLRREPSRISSAPGPRAPRAPLNQAPRSVSDGARPRGPMGHFDPAESIQMLNMERAN